MPPRPLPAKELVPWLNQALGKLRLPSTDGARTVTGGSGVAASTRSCASTVGGSGWSDGSKWAGMGGAVAAAVGCVAENVHADAAAEAAAAPGSGLMAIPGAAAPVSDLVPIATDEEEEAAAAAAAAAMDAAETAAACAA